MSSVAGRLLAGARVASVVDSAVAATLLLQCPWRPLRAARLLVLVDFAVASVADSAIVVVSVAAVGAVASIAVPVVDSVADAADSATKVIVASAAEAVASVAVIATVALRTALLLALGLVVGMAAVGMTTAAALATLISSHSLLVVDTATVIATMALRVVGMLDRSVPTTEVGMTSRARAVATEQAVTRPSSTDGASPSSSITISMHRHLTSLKQRKRSARPVWTVTK